jgi:hypothetical protein
MEFNNRTKNMIRSSSLALVERPVRNAIVLPSSNCEDIKELIRLSRSDELSFYHCFEHNVGIRRDMIKTLDNLGVSYKVHNNLETLNLRDILRNKDTGEIERTNFLNIDICGMLTSQFYNWLNFNLRTDRENILENDSFISVNICLTQRHKHFSYYSKEHLPTKSSSIHARRHLSNFEYSSIPEVFSTITDLIGDDNIFMSEQLVYQSDNAKMIMSTCNYLTK